MILYVIDFWSSLIYTYKPRLFGVYAQSIPTRYAICALTTYKQYRSSHQQSNLTDSPSPHRDSSL